MEINYSKSAEKVLRELERSVRANILSRIELLTKTPPQGDIQPIQGVKNTYRLRVGKYRIIYQYKDNILCIDNVGSRGDIYK